LLLGDRLSPKKTFWLMSIPHTASWIITIFAKSKWEFYGSRLLAGLGDALYYTAGPSYIGEISSPTVRGYFGNVPSIAINLGLFSITALGLFFTFFFVSVKLVIGQNISTIHLSTVISDKLGLFQ